MQKKINEMDINTDVDTFNKIRGKLKPTDDVNVVDKAEEKTSVSSYPTSSVMEEISTPTNTGIKYLSNVKDPNSGEISKPFTIGEKNYQMVRGISPEKEIILGVYCHDDLNESGENIIHPVDYFEENIAKPFKLKEDGFNYADAEIEHSNRQEYEKAREKEVPTKPVPELMQKKETVSSQPKTENNSLKLGEFKHFIINNQNGKVRKFKKLEELAKANMGDNETYMNLSQFKKHVDETLFGKKAKIAEDDVVPIKPDVQVAIDQMVQKVKPYINKINEPIEKIQFIVKLTNMIQLETSKYPLLMSELKKASDSSFGGTNAPNNPSTTQQTIGISEKRIITKNDLIKDLTNKNVIKTIKIKDIK